MKKTTNGFSKSFVIMIFLILFQCAVASATVVKKYDFSELVLKAKEIVYVVAEAKQSSPAQTRFGNSVITRITFRVIESLKGDKSAGETFILNFEGGDWESKGKLVVMGMPEFSLGKEYILFLRENIDSTCPLVGWWQGQFKVMRNPEGQDIVVDSEGREILDIKEGELVKKDSQERIKAASGTKENIKPIILGDFKRKIFDLIANPPQEESLSKQGGNSKTKFLPYRLKARSKLDNGENEGEVLTDGDPLKSEGGLQQ